MSSSAEAGRGLRREGTGAGVLRPQRAKKTRGGGDVPSPRALVGSGLLGAQAVRVAALVVRHQDRADGLRLAHVAASIGGDAEEGVRPPRRIAAFTLGAGTEAQ